MLVYIEGTLEHDITHFVVMGFYSIQSPRFLGSDWFFLCILLWLTAPDLLFPITNPIIEVLWLNLISAGVACVECSTSGTRGQLTTEMGNKCPHMDIWVYEDWLT